MSSSNLHKTSAWGIKELLALCALAITLGSGWLAASERMARLEERVQSLQVAKTEGAASTQRELDRVARALEALQSDIKDLRDQMRPPQRRSP